MRISGDPASPDFWRLAFAAEPKVRILLNGGEMKHVCFADDVAGVVIVEINDERGHIVCDHAGDIVTETMSGAVTIVGTKHRFG